MKTNETKQPTHTQIKHTYSDGEWILKNNLTIETKEGFEIATATDKWRPMESNEANAKRIVKCVNMHDELISSLASALNFINGCNMTYNEQMEMKGKIVSILNKAEQE